MKCVVVVEGPKYFGTVREALDYVRRVLGIKGRFRKYKDVYKKAEGKRTVIAKVRKVNGYEHGKIIDHVVLDYVMVCEEENGVRQ